MPFIPFEIQLIEALRDVARRPAFTIGVPCFQRLEGFIAGFMAGRLDPADDSNVQIFRKFSRWECETHGINKEASYAQVIRFYTPDDESAFALFFHDFEMFLKELEEAEGK